MQRKNVSVSVSYCETNALEICGGLLPDGLSMKSMNILCHCKGHNAFRKLDCIKGMAKKHFGITINGGGFGVACLLSAFFRHRGKHICPAWRSAWPLKREEVQHLSLDPLQSVLSRHPGLACKRGVRVFSVGARGAGMGRELECFMARVISLSCNHVWQLLFNGFTSLYSVVPLFSRCMVHVFVFLFKQYVCVAVLVARCCRPPANRNSVGTPI